MTVHGRVSDIWRSYVSQRLLWDVGCVVAFAPPMVDQFRSPHNYLGDIQVSAMAVGFEQLTYIVKYCWKL
jgi:hypothetical protein